MPARPQPIGRPQAQTRDRLILLGLIVFVIIGLVGLAAATGWEETLEQVRKLSLWQLAVLLSQLHRQHKCRVAWSMWP